MLLADQNKIYLALGVHNHQPIGNWDWVIEDSFQHSYLPFIDVLERHPGVHVTIHYAGHLLAWLADHLDGQPINRAVVTSWERLIVGRWTGR